MIAVTQMFGYGTEAVYFAALMIVVCCSIWLGKWTLKNLILFVMVVVTSIAVAKAGHEIIKGFNLNTQYTVQIPC